MHVHTEQNNLLHSIKTFILKFIQQSQNLLEMQVQSGKFMNSQNFYSIILTQVSRNVHHVLL